MILLHDPAGNEIAIRACDISRAERFKADGEVPAHTVLYTTDTAGWDEVCVTETPAEIVAMMRNDAKGYAP